MYTYACDMIHMIYIYTLEMYIKEMSFIKCL